MNWMDVSFGVLVGLAVGLAAGYMAGSWDARRMMRRLYHDKILESAAMGYRYGRRAELEREEEPL